MIRPKKLHAASPKDILRPKRTTWYHSFTFKLALIYLGMIILGSVAFAFQIQKAWDEYHDLARQRISWNVAEVIAEKLQPILSAGASYDEVMGHLLNFKKENPSVSVHLVAETGDVVTWDKTHHVMGNRQIVTSSAATINLTPIKQFLSLSSPPAKAIYTTLTYYGDIRRRSVFSAAKANWQGQQYYLVVLLKSKELYAITRAQGDSTLFLVGIRAISLTVLFTLLLGWIVIYFATRRIRRVSSALSEFASDSSLVQIEVEGRDEIAQMGVAFNSMAQTIRSNIDLLQRNDAARRSLFAHVSHDLRSPLAALQTSLELLNDHNNPLTAEQIHQLSSQSLEVCHDLHSLIADIFQLAKLDTQDYKLNIVEFDASVSLENIVNLSEAKAKKAEVELLLKPTEKTIVAFDEKLFQRMITNLVENAIRYTPAGGQVVVSIFREDDKIILRVDDTGIGISEQDLDRIFDSFYRSEKARKFSHDGTGLGLTICQRIAHLHNCEILVESKIDQGTAFIVKIPEN